MFNLVLTNSVNDFKIKLNLYNRNEKNITKIKTIKMQTNKDKSNI